MHRELRGVLVRFPEVGVVGVVGAGGREEVAKFESEISEITSNDSVGVS